MIFMARGIARTYADLRWGSRQTIGCKIHVITKHWHLIIDGCEVQILTKAGSYSYTYGEIIRIAFIIGTTIVRYSYHNGQQRLILQRNRQLRELRCVADECRYLEMLASIVDFYVDGVLERVTAVR